MNMKTAVIVLCAVAVGLAWKEQAPAQPAREASMSIQISSSAFAADKPIPKKYTGEGQNISPPLAWSNVPAGTKELAIIMDDPDAPRPQPWVHWLMYKIAADAVDLPEGVPTKEKLDRPAGALQGKNTSKGIGYTGPMPPPGHGVHHYHFKVYALDASLDLKGGTDKETLLAAMKGHVLAEGELIGTYERK